MKNSIQILFLVLYSFNISAQTDNIFNAEQLNSEKGVPWGEYQYLSEKIKNAQASTVRITASTAVMISPTHAITAAHSPLDENNEITPDLKVQNIFGEVRNITNVIYDLPSDFAIVELESPFDNSFSVKIAEFDSSSGDPVFSIGNPKDTAWGGVGWAVSFGFARDILFELYFKLFDIQIMGGFSGGGVYNDQGHLVGINSGTTSHMSEGSFRPKMKNFTGIFDEDFSILDGPWKSLNNFQVTAISLSFIKEFMSSHNINNEVSNLNIDLPENKIDNYFDSLTDEEENEMQSMSKSVRESVVAISVGYSLSSGFYPNGSGVLLTPRIVATNSHVVEGKETFIITLHDGSEINGSVLDHHGEMDVSLILLDSPVTSIEPVKIASSRSKLGDKGFVIGHPFDLWSQNGGWQVASAISGYKTTQIDDRGDVLLEGGAQSGMSGGPIFNSNAELIGINYAGGSSLSSELNDYQDPHASYYNPIVSPGTINVVGVDASGIRDLIDDNSIFFDDHVSSLSAIEKEYFADQSENLFSIENNNDFLSLSKLTDYEFKHIKNIDPNIESNLKWKVLDVLSNEENEFYVINTYIDDYVPGINIVKLDGSLNVDSNFANAGYYNRIFENIETQKVINSKIYNDFLYILTQDNRNQQVSYSIHKIDLINPQNLITVFSSINDINHSSNFFPKDFEVDENGFFILGTTDYAESTVSQGSRSYDFFVSNYTHEGTLNPSFANGGIFQKDYGKTDKASDIVIQPDGKIIISGIKWTDQAPDAIATRLNNNGSVDLTFGNNGTTLISMENQKTSSIDDLGREEANEILIDENGNIYIAGTKYFGKSSGHNDLSASDGGYQSSIWKYDTNGAIVESFGNIDYENGSIPGLSSIEINGENKIQRLMLIGDQIIAIIFTREGISKSTSSKIFKIDKQTGQPEIYAYDKISFFIPKKLEGWEDNPIKNVPMKFWLPPNKDYNYSFSSPANGAIVDNNNLSFDYIPNKDYFGIDSFIFELEVDDTIITKTIDIDVKPMNDFPAIYGENNIEIHEDNNLNLKIYDADGDDDILDYNFLVPENGVIIDQGDLTFTYIPNKDFFGFERLQINVEHVEPLIENEIYNSNIYVEINILAVNDPPVVEEGSLTIDEDNLGVLTLQANDVDSNNLTFSIVDSPSNGEVSIEGDDVTYTPAKNFNGEDTFTYKASDGSDDSNLSTVTVIVNPINDPPVVEEGSLTIDEDNLGVLTLQGNDVDSNNLTFSIVDTPSNGEVSIEGDDVTYTPNDDYNGEDTFTYKASDGSDESNLSTVTVIVNPINDPPVVEEGSLTIDEDNLGVLTLQANDVDSNNLTFSIVDTPSNGEVSIEGDLVTYTPNDDYNGEDTFTYKASDGSDDSNLSTVTVIVNPINDPPVVEEGSLTIDEDNLGVLTLQGNDVDSNNLTFSIVDTPSNGEVSIEGDLVTYTPNDDYNGEDTFTYKASDGSDDSNLSTVTVIVNPINDPPVVEELSLSTSLNTEISAEFDGSDVDENTLIYKVVVNPKNGSLSIENNTFVYTPDNNYVGQDTFNYKANDGSVDSNEAIIFINIDDVDTDNDGISDRYDNCPDTPDGAVIDVNGCEVFALPIDNFKVEVGGATCIGNNNGIINLSVEDASYNYTVTITGKDSMTISGTSKTTSVTELAKGTYTVCFRVDGQNNYEQCFEVQVKEPPALSAFMKISGKLLNITMSGSDEYSIDVNGNTQKINSNKYETTLSSGLNIIKVYTSLECQGFVQEQVLISEDVYYYPNPTKNNVNIIVGGKDNKVSLSVYTIDGVLIYSREQLLDDISRKTIVDLSKYTSGTYIIVIESESISQTFKIIKE